MQLSHIRSRVSWTFDEPNLVADAGLVPIMALAARAGLEGLVADRVTLSGAGSANAPVKVSALLAGMVAGADSIDDMDRLRHGAMPRVFEDVRAPSTLGTFLRAFTFGHVRQLDAVAARFLPGLARQCPGLLAGADLFSYLDVDDTIKATYGYRKEGAGYGYSKVKGLNALLGVLSTPLAAPVVVATRLRRGPANSARGAARLVADALRTARASGATGTVVVRADSAFYGAEVVAAAVRAGARFSVTARQSPAVQAAIGGIAEHAWTPIHYPDAFIDPDTGELVSDAEVAEVPFTAFTGRPTTRQVTARLIVRRVKRLGRPGTPDRGEQGELFPVYRHHACFTDSPLGMLDAEKAHRGHAVIEQVIADLKNGPLAHLPSGRFTANAAWLVLAALAFNLTRAAATLTGGHLARATTATIRRALVTVPARIARRAHGLILHLPQGWHRQAPLDLLLETALRSTPAAPPQAA